MPANPVWGPSPQEAEIAALKARIARVEAALGAMEFECAVPSSPTGKPCREWSIDCWCPPCRLAAIREALTGPGEDK